MPISSYRFIDPLTLAAISNLELLAKTVVDGFMIGAHQSPVPGAGLEFNQFRSYQPGDDVRRVDWKLFARSDRYYIRESEVETSITVRFILDASASMLHEESKISKFNYARFLIASLGYLAHLQGDAIGIYAINDKEISLLTPKGDHQHLHRFIHELEKIKAVGIWPNWDELENIFLSGQKRELVIFVSDMYEYSNEIREVLRKLHALKNEVILFQLTGRNELDFTYEGALTFEDLETGKKIQANSEQIRKSYLKKFRESQNELRQTLHDNQIEYQQLILDQPLDFALRSYLSQRAKLSI